MTSLLFQAVLAPQAAQEPSLAPRALGKQTPSLDFDLLLADPEDADAEAVPWFPVEATPQPPSRRQGPQLAADADVWPTSALTSFPPFDGQALATSAPGAPDGPRVQIAWLPTDLETSSGPWSTDLASAGHDAGPDSAPDLLSEMPTDATKPTTTTGGLTIDEPVMVETASSEVGPRTPDVENRPVVVRSGPPPQPAQAEMYDPPETAFRTQLDAQGNVRVELDADLAVEIRQARQGMEVTIDGTSVALEPMEGIDQEIDAALEDAGSSLDRFTKQTRPRHLKPNSRRGDDDGNSPVISDEPSPVLLGDSLIHVVA